MTALKIRRLPWRFGADTPFQWNPANPAFGLGMNTLSFLGPPFERYIVLAVREAMRVIEDPEVMRDEPVPPFADEWLAAYDAGRNVVDWYQPPEEGARSPR